MDDRIRTSDADRDLVTGRLRDHYAEGRLTRDELDERITAALGAKTFGELRRVMADLPEPRLVPLAATQPPMRRAMSSPGPAFHHRRHGPRLLPVLALALLVSLLISGSGAAIIAVKIAAIMVGVIFAIFAVTAFAATRFIRRARRGSYAGHVHHHAWNWPEVR